MRSYTATLFRLAISVLSLVPALPLHAQTSAGVESPPPQRFSYADLQRLRSVDDVELSPDGSRVAYTVAAVISRKDRTVESLWVLQLLGSRALPVEVGGAASPSWSPDNRRLAVVQQDGAGKSLISLLRSDTLGEAQSFPVPSSPNTLVWSPDSKSIAFTLFVPDVDAASFLQRAVDAAESDLQKPAGAKWSAPVQVTEAARYRKDGGTWLTPGHTHLFVLSLDTAQVHQVGSEPFDDGEPAWMPDSSTLLFTSDRRPNVERLNRRPAIYKTDLAGHATQLTHIEGSCYAPAVSKDGLIAYTEMPWRAVNYTRNDLYVMRPDGRDIRRLATGLDRDVYGPQWAADSKGVYAEYADHGVLRLALFDLNGGERQRVSGVGNGFSIAQDGTIAFAGISSTEPNELQLQRPGQSARPLTALNDFLKHRALATLSQLKARSIADGTPVEGWALLPAGHRAGTKLPTIFAMHGGPFGSDGPDWSSKYQLFAAAGYAVVYANYRGSTSYGASFSEPANHDFPGLAYDDMMSITDEAVHEGFADPNRLFVTGGSAGGELTAWITGKTSRFRAAVAEKPVINLLSDALTSDQYLSTPDVYGGLPWTKERELWAHSPLSLATSMRKPMLLIVGEEDYRTPLDQTLQIYDALQLQGVPTALVRVPGAGHESLSGRPSRLAAEQAAALAWFDKYGPSSVRAEDQ